MSNKGTVDAMPAGTTSGTPQVLLGHHLKQLKLPTVLREYDKVARECARDGVDHPRYLLRLVELELIDRERRVVERRIRQARFQATKSLDTFDFTAIPSLNKMLVLELARCEFILRRENVIALGNSGTGKSHVALALGLAACQKGFPVAFTTAAALVHQLMEARDERRLLKLQRELQAVKLLIVDELGYPWARPEEQGRLDLGKGPGISQGANTSPIVFDLLMSSATQKGIPFQRQATGSTSPTDARVVQVSRGGVATGVISVPLRYMHTPSEVVCLRDVDATIDLVCEYCRRIRPDTDFTPW